MHKSSLLSLLLRWSFLCSASLEALFVFIQTFIGLKFHPLYKTQTHFRSGKIALLLHMYLDKPQLSEKTNCPTSWEDYQQWCIYLYFYYCSILFVRWIFNKTYIFSSLLCDSSLRSDGPKFDKCILTRPSPAYLNRSSETQTEAQIENHRSFGWLIYLQGCKFS